MKRLISLYYFTLLVLFGCSGSQQNPPGFEENSPDHGLEIVEGVHMETGLADDPDLPLIITNCTACHSAILITQNRASREGWKEMIDWMQETQNLWDLGENEEIILGYLEKNYSPDKRQTRRRNLEHIEWYNLD